MSWNRIDSLEPWDLYDHFNYIREDAECQGFEDDYDVENYVKDEFARSFPQIWDRIGYDDISVEHYEHELQDDEVKPTHAVYIYFNENVTDVIEDLLPEYFI